MLYAVRYGYGYTELYCCTEGYDTGAALASVPSTAKKSGDFYSMSGLLVDHFTEGPFFWKNPSRIFQKKGFTEDRLFPGFRSGPIVL